MTENLEPGPTGDARWLEWAKRLAAASQSGLAYRPNVFDEERYRAIQAIAAEMMAEGAGAPLEQARDLLSSEVGHATPKIDVRGVVFRDDGILLVRERSDGLWSLPGGWADVYDTPSQATVREIFEESGYRTTPRKLLALLDRNRQGHAPPMPFHVYKIFFWCELTSGEAQTSIETDAIDFFPRDGLPELSIGRVTRAQIERFFEHRDHPDWPTDFD